MRPRRCPVLWHHSHCRHPSRSGQVQASGMSYFSLSNNSSCPCHFGKWKSFNGTSLVLQVNKEKYKSLGNGFKITVAEQGAKGLLLGWAPTAIGYSMQGLCKFGFYEVNILQQKDGINISSFVSIVQNRSIQVRILRGLLTLKFIFLRIDTYLLLEKQKHSTWCT